MNLKLHTLIVFVNTDTTITSNFVNFFLQNENLYLRTSILSFKENKYPLDLLEKKLLQATTYPHTNEFILLKTDTISDEFLSLVKQVSSKNEYNLLFIEDEKNAKLHNPQLQNHIFTLDKHNAPKLEIEQIKNWKETQFFLEKNCFIIGDIHEDLVSFKNLIKEIDINDDIILVGDYLDKGNNTKETIDYLYDLEKQRNIKIVIGNHESFVARRLLNEIKAIGNENENFSSLQILQEDNDAKEKFLSLYKKSLPFLHVFNQDVEGYITHAPCKNKYLGKMSPNGQKNQRNMYFKERTLVAMQKELNFVFKEANSNHPFHFFGHVPHSEENVFFLNKFWLDTGSVYGHKLTGILLKPSGEIEIKSTQGNKLSQSRLFTFEKQ